MTIGAKAWTAKCRSTTSSANSAPAIGALNEAETAAATAQPSRSRAVTPCAAIRLLTQVEITAARCTTGPSRPEDPPDPSVISEAAAEASPARISTRPSRIAAPSITSATVCTRASGVKRHSSSPTIRPPSAGQSTKNIHGRSRLALASVVTSSTR